MQRVNGKADRYFNVMCIPVQQSPLHLFQLVLLFLVSFLFLLPVAICWVEGFVVSFSVIQRNTKGKGHLEHYSVNLHSHSSLETRTKKCLACWGERGVT